MHTSSTTEGSGTTTLHEVVRSFQETYGISDENINAMLGFIHSAENTERLTTELGPNILNNLIAKLPDNVLKLNSDSERNLELKDVTVEDGPADYAYKSADAIEALRTLLQLLYIISHNNNKEIILNGVSFIDNHHADKELNAASSLTALLASIAKLTQFTSKQVEIARKFRAILKVEKSRAIANKWFSSIKNFASNWILRPVGNGIIIPAAFLAAFFNGFARAWNQGFGDTLSVKGVFSSVRNYSNSLFAGSWGAVALGAISGFAATVFLRNLYTSVASAYKGFDEKENRFYFTMIFKLGKPKVWSKKASFAQNLWNAAMFIPRLLADITTKARAKTLPKANGLVYGTSLALAGFAIATAVGVSSVVSTIAIMALTTTAIEFKLSLADRRKPTLVKRFEDTVKSLFLTAVSAGLITAISLAWSPLLPMLTTAYSVAAIAPISTMQMLINSQTFNSIVYEQTKVALVGAVTGMLLTAKNLGILRNPFGSGDKAPTSAGEFGAGLYPYNSSSYVAGYDGARKGDKTGEDRVSSADTDGTEPRRRRGVSRTGH